jgi:hypothetical protein
VADAAGAGADEHLSRAGAVDLDFFDRQRAIDLAQHGCLHDAPPGGLRTTGKMVESMLGMGRLTHSVQNSRRLGAM